MKWRILGAVVLSLICLWLFVRSQPREDEIEYHGEHIKLSRKYGDYETYKNDPNNIDPRETERVQRLVRQAPIAGSFDDRIGFARATGEIAFPGYGRGPMVDTPQADGSILVITAIEVPRAQQERYFTARINGGRYALIDDFLAPESARLVHVQQRGENLVYLNDRGQEALVRPRR